MPSASKSSGRSQLGFIRNVEPFTFANSAMHSEQRYDPMAAGSASKDDGMAYDL